jgi:hypothetical protein
MPRQGLARPAGGGMRPAGLRKTGVQADVCVSLSNGVTSQQGLCCLHF